MEQHGIFMTLLRSWDKKLKTKPRGTLWIMLSGYAYRAFILIRISIAFVCRLLDEFGDQVDKVQGRLSRAMSKVAYIIKKNEGRVRDTM